MYYYILQVGVLGAGNNGGQSHQLLSCCQFEDVESTYVHHKCFMSPQRKYIVGQTWLRIWVISPSSPGDHKAWSMSFVKAQITHMHFFVFFRFLINHIQMFWVHYWKNYVSWLQTYFKMKGSIQELCKPNTVLMLRAGHITFTKANIMNLSWT